MTGLDEILDIFSEDSDGILGDVVFRVDEKTYTTITAEAIIAVFELESGKAVEVFAPP